MFWALAGEPLDLKKGATAREGIPALLFETQGRAEQFPYSTAMG
jgi:hypothetical protein